jgi:uncharacterized membrane protein YkgB
MDPQCFEHEQEQEHEHESPFYSPSTRPLVQLKANFRRTTYAMGTILLIILILLLIGALPTWPYSSGWGYYPTGGLGLIVVIILVLVLIGRI